MGKKSKKARVDGEEGVAAGNKAAAEVRVRVAAEGRPPSVVEAKATKRKSDIDDIFGALGGGSGGKKPKAPPDTEPQAPTEGKGKGKGKGSGKADPKSSKPNNKVEGSVDDIFGAEAAQARRRTEEGYAIYKEDELRINKGGDTDLCPFDCTCCY